MVLNKTENKIKKNRQKKKNVKSKRSDEKIVEKILNGDFKTSNVRKIGKNYWQFCYLNNQFNCSLFCKGLVGCGHNHGESGSCDDEELIPAYDSKMEALEIFKYIIRPIKIDDFFK